MFVFDEAGRTQSYHTDRLLACLIIRFEQYITTREPTIITTRRIYFQYHPLSTRQHSWLGWEGTLFCVPENVDLEVQAIDNSVTRVGRGGHR